jgi:glutamyl-tRNA reductase
MNIAVVGLSHKTASVDIREKLSIPEAKLDSALAELNSYPNIEEAAIISTCNRLEIYVVTQSTEAGTLEVVRFLSDYSSIPKGTLRQHLFILLQQDTVMHLMRVSAGLDSLVIGEGQILSQVKHAHKLAQQHKGLGRVLNQLFKQAITAGKRVRSETSINTGAVSISSAAVELAEMKRQNLRSARVAIVGAGKMSRLLVQHLLAKGCESITVLNRTQKRAEELAERFSNEATIEVAPLSDLMSTLGHSDVVFTSTASTEPILDRAKVESNLPADHQMMLLDISVPRNIDADVKDLDNIQAFNVDDLKAVVAQNQETRRKMMMEAEKILEDEMNSFEVWWHSLETIPTINSLRKKAETIREQEMEKALSRLGSEFAEKHQEVIEALTRGIVNKILHDPMVQLRAQQDSEARRHAMQTLQLLFNLESETSSRKKYS